MDDLAAVIRSLWADVPETGELILQLCDALEAAQATNLEIIQRKEIMARERDAAQAENTRLNALVGQERAEAIRLEDENTRLTQRLHHPEYDARLLRAVEAEPEMVVEVLELREERDRLARQVTDLADALTSTASLLYDLWRCNDDSERRELGQRIGAAIDAYARHPSKLDLLLDATPSEDQ